MTQQDTNTDFKTISEQGSPQAQYELGELYRRGPERNDKQAIYWYTKASKNGNADATERLKKLGIK